MLEGWTIKGLGTQYSGDNIGTAYRVIPPTIIIISIIVIITRINVIIIINIIVITPTVSMKS